MTNELPTDFLDKCSSDEREQVERWWDSLQDDNRDDVRVLLDRQGNRTSIWFSVSGLQ